MADTPFVRGQVEDEDRRYPTSRETADHSFYYLAAAALMDGEMTQAQFEGERWMQPAVKSLMERMTIRTDASLNKYTPGKLPLCIAVDHGERRKPHRGSFLSQRTSEKPHVVRRGGGQI